MKSSSIFKSLFAAAAAVLAFAFVAPASATCVSGCVPTTSTPTPNSSPSLNFIVGGGATFNGSGAALFQGDEGYAIAEKKGGGAVETTMKAAGGLCGVTCGDGSYTFKGMSFENVTAAAGAKTIKPNVQATVVNQGGAFSSLNFQFMKNTGQ